MLEEVQKPSRRAFEGRLDAKELRQLVDHDDDCDPAEEASHHWSRQKIANPPHLSDADNQQEDTNDERGDKREPDVLLGASDNPYADQPRGQHRCDGAVHAQGKVTVRSEHRRHEARGKESVEAGNCWHPCQMSSRKLAGDCYRPEAEAS
ncbi:MAG: hypothetical protein BWZ07_03339 [Alphaproteobacteria bacterium ADurb.BinA280]|nr:MAG: hypothetical protein BWZ07_03339 [Alphaproteobacteria bacterium ADurb.BinA280]